MINYFVLRIFVYFTFIKHFDSSYHLATIKGDFGHTTMYFYHFPPQIQIDNKIEVPIELSAIDTVLATIGISSKEGTPLKGIKNDDYFRKIKRIVVVHSNVKIGVKKIGVELNNPSYHTQIPYQIVFQSYSSFTNDLENDDNFDNNQRIDIICDNNINLDVLENKLKTLYNEDFLLFVHHFNYDKKEYQSLESNVNENFGKGTLFCFPYIYIDHNERETTHSGNFLDKCMKLKSTFTNGDKLNLLCDGAALGEYDAKHQLSKSITNGDAAKNNLNTYLAYNNSYSPSMLIRFFVILLFFTFVLIALGFIYSIKTSDDAILYKPIYYGGSKPKLD